MDEVSARVPKIVVVVFVTGAGLVVLVRVTSGVAGAMTVPAFEASEDRHH